MNAALLLSCSSFETFYGRVMKLSPEEFVEKYRNDWAWYYSDGILKHGIKPFIYIPTMQTSGLKYTRSGIGVRFLPMGSWYHPLERSIILKKFIRQSRFSLYFDELLNVHSFEKELHASLSEDKIDLLYIQEYWTARFDRLVTKLHLPVVAADHGALAKGTFKLFKRGAFRRASAIYSQTREECTRVSKMGGNSVYQPNGVDTIYFVPGPEQQRTKRVLIVARLTNKQKRISDLIRAMLLLDESWSLDIAGEGPDKIKLRRLVERLGLVTRVKFHGFVGRSEVRQLLQNCGVYAMPSSNEALAISALEAMSCGAAVTLSRIPSFVELVNDGVNGILFDVGDVRSLARSIESAWRQRADLGKNAHQFVAERYAANVVYRDLADSLKAAAT